MQTQSFTGLLNTLMDSFFWGISRGEDLKNSGPKNVIKAQSQTGYRRLGENEERKLHNTPSPLQEPKACKYVAMSKGWREASGRDKQSAALNIIALRQRPDTASFCL